MTEYEVYLHEAQAMVDQAIGHIKMAKKKAKMERKRQRRRPSGRKASLRITDSNPNHIKPDRYGSGKRYTKSGCIRLGKFLNYI